jgi:hypothetical protein
MYVDVEFTAPGASGPVVPEAAVQSIGERQSVFLPVKNNEGVLCCVRCDWAPQLTATIPCLKDCAFRRKL